MEKAKLSPPWMTYVKKLEMLFGRDPDIEITFIGAADNPKVNLLVKEDKKAHALTQILPTAVSFGDVALNIAVIPANGVTENYAKLFKEAFANNPVLKDVLIVDTPNFHMSYVIFQKQVVQFFNDNLGEPHGYSSMLFEDIARQVFRDGMGVSFCTDYNKDE